MTNKKRLFTIISCFIFSTSIFSMQRPVQRGRGRPVQRGRGRPVPRGRGRFVQPGRGRFVQRGRTMPQTFIPRGMPAKNFTSKDFNDRANALGIVYFATNIGPSVKISVYGNPSAINPKREIMERLHLLEQNGHRIEREAGERDSKLNFDIKGGDFNAAKTALENAFSTIARSDILARNAYSNSGLSRDKQNLVYAGIGSGDFASD